MVLTPEKKVSLVEIGEFLKSHPSWSLEEGRLEREYQFDDFTRSMLFLNKIVNPIQEHDLYPRITITYNLVRLSLLNPHTGTLTENDLKMAHEFDELSGSQGSEEPKGVPV